MAKDNKLLPIILCGGSGTRLWPLSRRSFPKQYLSINNKKNSSFLQITIKRIKELKNSEHPIVICNEEHRFITAEQLRQIKVNPGSILLEPISRNTAPAIAVSALKSMSEDNDPILLIMPSDHLITNEVNFINSIEKAKSSALEGKIVTFGIKPNNAATGFGYIKANHPFQKNLLKPYQIEEFVEKPNKNLAEKFFKDDKYSWNSGIFMAKASILIQEFNIYSPEIVSHCKESLQNKTKDLDFERLGVKAFRECPNISVDKAIMEKTSLGVVFPLEVDWSDIGSWNSFWEKSSKDKNGNVFIGDAIGLSSKNCLINSNSRLTVGLDVDDLIIIETNDAVLVANKARSQDIKGIVSLLNEKQLSEGNMHKKVFRPWGSYFSIAEEKGWQVKRINVNPGASLSLQKHKFRTEHWIVVSGKALVELEGKTKTLKANESTYIPLGFKHRLSNPGEIPLIIIEVQSGKYLGEDDIIRFKDMYGRKVV